MGTRSLVGPLVARAALVLAALALALVLAPGLRSARDQARGLEDAQTRLSASEFARVDALLARAAGRTGSTEPDLDRVRLMLFARREAPAVGILRRVLREEPQNAEAWALLVRGLRTSDPRGAAAALARYRALSPRVPAPAG